MLKDIAAKIIVLACGLLLMAIFGFLVHERDVRQVEECRQSLKEKP